MIPIPLEARQTLSDYLTRRASKAEYVFEGQRGAFTIEGVAWVVKKYGRFVDLEVTPHLLRHTFAYSYLANNQNDLVGLAKILGHDSVETTQIYTQKRMMDLEAAVENVKFH